MRTSFQIKNPTNFPSLESTKSFVEVGNSFIWSTIQSKILSYEVRLYYEWIHCTCKGGKAFYYTLTYNDKHIPMFHGIPCFRYSDIRDLFNGAFAKMLLRHHGYTFKYFVACESGEGKGKRGYSNNPHYHIIFFLYPDNALSSITSVEFRTLVRRYWQGADVGEGDVNWHPNTFKYGIAKEGSRKGHDDCGLVSDFHALKYVCKYVVKDSDFRHQYTDDNSEYESNSKIKFSHDRYVRIKSVLYDMAFRQVYEDASVRDKFFEEFVSPEVFVEYSFRDCDTLVNIRDWFVDIYSFRFEKYIHSLVNERYQALKAMFDNEYGQKVRISHGVGLSALNHIDSVRVVDGVVERVPDCLADLTVSMPGKDGIKSVPIGRYLYRKLFYDVKRDPVSGSPYYSLNKLGIEYRVRTLDKRLYKFQEEFISLNVLCRLGDGEFKEDSIYNKIYEYVKSHFNYYGSRFVFPDFPSYCQLIDPFFKGKDILFSELAYRYALYKEVYQGRFFSSWLHDVAFSEPPISPTEDLSRFLADTHEISNYHPEGYDIYRRFESALYQPYEVHSYFYSYLDLFRVFDIIRDYFAFQTSEQKRKEFLEQERLLNFLKNLNIF